ncbi:MAG: type II toxin-antitoxin system HicB family antitoxin [Thermomicrobiales bacterium]|nr:type II toxin-antitoxin system HicB family antitoxin [Thermomicrobiales bacterium]
MNTTLEEALSRHYRFDVIADPDGGYVVRFPDLPGCMTQVENVDEVSAAAEEIRTLWIETTFDLGQEIPLPTYPEEFSGKFNVRIPRSLHRDLVHRAEEEGVSLNQLVVSLLSDRSRWGTQSPGPQTTQRSSEPRKLAKVS